MEERAYCFTLTVFLMSCDSQCCVALPRSAMGWSVVCDCDIPSSNSLALFNYVLTYHSLTPLQSGFVLGDSTTLQLLHTYHMFCEAVDNDVEGRTAISETLSKGSGTREYFISYVE